MKIFGLDIFAHRRRTSVSSIAELRDLINRFLLDCPKYDFEWDDFISWKNDNAFIESVRKELESTEPLLYSQKLDDKHKALALLREKVAYLDTFLK